MRAVAALLVIPDSDKNPQLNELVLQIRSSPELRVILFIFISSQPTIAVFSLFFFHLSYQSLFDSIQKDNSGHLGNSATSSTDSNMDLS